MGGRGKEWRDMEEAGLKGRYTSALRQGLDCNLQTGRHQITKAICVAVVAVGEGRSNPLGSRRISSLWESWRKK